MQSSALTEEIAAMLAAMQSLQQKHSNAMGSLIGVRDGLVDQGMAIDAATLEYIKGFDLETSIEVDKVPKAQDVISSPGSSPRSPQGARRAARTVTTMYAEPPMSPK